MLASSTSCDLSEMFSATKALALLDRRAREPTHEILMSFHSTESSGCIAEIVFTSQIVSGNIGIKFQSSGGGAE